MSDSLIELPVVEPVKKKKNVPWWAALIIIVALVGGIYYEYNQLTTPVAHTFKTLKRGSAKKPNGAAEQDAPMPLGSKN